MSNLRIAPYGKVHRWDDTPVEVIDGVSVLQSACGRYTKSVESLTDLYDPNKTDRCMFCFPEWHPTRAPWLQSIYDEKTKQRVPVPRDLSA